MRKPAPARTILLCGEVNEDMVEDFMNLFLQLDSVKQPGGIIVRITSHGGCAGAGFAIYDAIRGANNRVTTEVYGMAESAAALIFQAGHRRLMAPSARILVHDVQSESSSSTGSRGIQAHADDVRSIEEAYFRIIAERVGCDVDKVRGWCRDITRFSASQALEAHLADAIIRE